MKKNLVALAVLGSLVGVAQADSGVTVWGNIDVGVMSVSSPAGHTTGYTDGQLAPSEFGLKGTEDLGGGLKVGFALTAGFDSGNGTQDDSNAPGALFGREAKLTLGGEWGTVGAGLQFDPGLLASIATEPRGLADTFSLLGPAVGVTLLTPPACSICNKPAGSGGAFDANSVSYTYSGNGLYLGLLHTFGQQAGNSSANSGNSAGISYTNSGLTASASYAALNNPQGTSSSQYTIFGLGYANGPFAVRAQSGDYKTMYGLVQAGVAATDVKAWGVGADWKMSTENKLNLSYYDAKDNGAIGGGKTTTVALLDTYSLSKHTTLFVQVASMKVDANAGLSNLMDEIYAPAGIAAPGGNSTAFGFGLNHHF